MNPLVWRALVLVSLTILAAAACGRGTPPDPAESRTPPAPATAERAAAQDGTALGHAVRAALAGGWEASYFDASADLDGDGEQEAVVYVAGPMVCGTGGCPLFVFTPAFDRYRLVSRISVTRTPVRLSPGSSSGWRNLVVGVRGGGGAAGNAELKFDGTRYPPNPTVPPAEAVTDLAGTEILIADFGSYTEGTPVPAVLYGDPDSPLAAEVLGMPVHTQDAEELRYVVLLQLTNRYADERGIVVAPEETAAYIEHMRSALSKDPNFAGAVPDDAESADDRAAREQIAAAFIRQWKLNRALYQQYEGRIIFQQGGPEPLDAYRKFLEEHESDGDFRIVNRALEAEFWRYYRDDSIHSFFAPGSAVEAQAFADPPWLAN